MWEALNGLHLNIYQCYKGAEWNRHRMAAEEAISVTERNFRYYGRTMTTVMVFKYLGCILTASDYEFPVVVGINKYYSGEQLGNYHQKRVRLNYHYFVVMENR